VIDHPRTLRLITVLIIINAVTLGLETSPSVMARWGSFLVSLDHAILAVFVIELAARIAVERLRFFRDPWNLFDFAVVAISLLPVSESFSVLRALRVLRVLRLITVVPTLRRVVAGLISALPGMGSIVLLIGLIYYVFAVMGTKLYGGDFPHLFGSLPTSLFTLFTVMTLEGWVENVVGPMMEKYPFAWLFFIPFIIGTTFTVLNLFIGVIVNAMQTEHDKGLKAELEAEREIVQDETAPLAAELRALRGEVAALREALQGDRRA
jgi:voltage-gated sodium channel